MGAGVGCFEGDLVGDDVGAVGASVGDSVGADDGSGGVGSAVRVGYILG